jgi:hypothetical protein
MFEGADVPVFEQFERQVVGVAVAQDIARGAPRGFGLGRGAQGMQVGVKLLDAGGRGRLGPAVGDAIAVDAVWR